MRKFKIGDLFYVERNWIKEWGEGPFEAIDIITDPGDGQRVRFVDADGDVRTRDVDGLRLDPFLTAAKNVIRAKKNVQK